tara:strand:- start:1790 stop:2185 length:396 start_codon:yes stop_codon:yes gene_type:complete
MNVNLVIREDAPVIAGHQNILFTQLDQIPPSACKAVVLNDTFNYLTDEQSEILLGKVRHGGTLSISSPDAMVVATSFCWGIIDIKVFSSLTSHKVQQHSLLDVKSKLENNGYIIEIANITEMSFYIKAKRP